MLTTERLKELLAYNPTTGIFTWLMYHGGASADTVAGSCMLAGGYRFINIDHRFYMAHVLACYFMNGEWPEKKVIHKNDIQDDNRFENLEY